MINNKKKRETEWKRNLISVSTLVVLLATSNENTAHPSNTSILISLQVGAVYKRPSLCVVSYMSQNRVSLKSIFTMNVNFSLAVFWSFHQSKHASAGRMQDIFLLIITQNTLEFTSVGNISLDPFSSPSFATHSTRVEICWFRVDKHRRWLFSWAL